MTVYPTNIAITYGYVSSYLAQVDIAKQKVFSTTSINSKLATQILLATKTIQKIYNISPSESNLPKCTNYLISLCGKYIIQAQSITGSGGIVNPATGTISTIQAIDLQFQIGTGTPPIDPNTGLPLVAGGTAFVLPYTYILNKSVGIVYNGTPLPMNQPDRLSYTIVYSTGSATITFNQPVQSSDLIVATGLQYVTV